MCSAKPIKRREMLAIVADMRLEGRDKEARATLAEHPRDWRHDRHESDENAIVLHAGASLSYERSVVMINPTEKRYHSASGWRMGSRVKGPSAYVLQFGAYGCTNLHVYASSLDDALEACAEWLAKYAPGHIEPLAGAVYQELMAEECEERGLHWPPPDDADMQAYWDVEETALADMTQTESGYLTSHEFCIALECPTVEELYQFVFFDE